MEIRERIKFLNDSNILCEITRIESMNNDLMINWESIDLTAPKFSLANIDYILTKLRTNKFKLQEYPYQVGDWVYDINDRYVISHNTPKICQITNIVQDRYYVNNELQCSYIANFQEVYRPCFKDEIPNNQIVKEDLKYLIPFINKLNNYG